MSDDHDVQDWFNRSVEAPPRQPFTQAVLAQVQRRERLLQLQRYAAMLLVFASLCLLLQELGTVLSSLPLVLADLGGEYWPWLVLTAIGLLWWLFRQARNTGLLPGVLRWH